MKKTDVTYTEMIVLLNTVLGKDKVKQAYKLINDDKEFKQFLTRSYNKINSLIYRNAKGFKLNGTRVSVICNI